MIDCVKCKHKATEERYENPYSQYEVNMCSLNPNWEKIPGYNTKEKPIGHYCSNYESKEDK